MTKAKAAETKAAAKVDLHESFTVIYQGKPVLQVTWLDSIYDQEILSKSDLPGERNRFIEEYVSAGLSNRIEDLLFVLTLEACYVFSANRNGKQPDAGAMKEIAKYERLATEVRLRWKRKSKPRKWTPELIAEAAALFVRRHRRVKKAKKFYNQKLVKGSKVWPKLVHDNDPKLPESIINEFPFKPPRELAREWTAADLNSRHSGLAATADSLRPYLKKSSRVPNAGAKAETPAL